MLWCILDLCSGESSPCLVERYCSQVRALSSTSIVCSPASQVSSLRSILYRILQDLVTFRAHWRVTVWKTINLSAFQQRCRTPVSSADSAWTKRRLNLPLGASYLLTCIIAKVLHLTCHAWSSFTSPLRCYQSLECTQSLYTSLIRRSFPMGTYPGIYPAVPSPSSVSSFVSPVAAVFVLISPPWCSSFCVAYGNGGASLRATPPSDSPRMCYDISPPSAETVHWCPRHRQLLQCRPAFRKAHFWVFQANIGPHLQQASAGSPPNISGGCVPPVSFCYNKNKRLHLLPLLELNLVRFQLKIITYLMLFLS